MDFGGGTRRYQLATIAGNTRVFRPENHLGLLSHALGKWQADQREAGFSRDIAIGT